MKALVFGGDPVEPRPVAPEATRLERHLATTPMALCEVDPPALPADDWVLVRTRLCGICGSDTKQVLMDFDDAADNPMTALISFPQVLGHEVVGEVAQVGRAVRALESGQRVVLDPWLACGPRGIDPPCASCQRGDLSVCRSFCAGRLRPGIHVGNSCDAPGGFAEFFAAHASMLHPVPDGLDDETAVLADPFAVSLHAITRNPPPPGGQAVVYGAGALGTTACAILAALHPDVEVVAVAAWPAQRAMVEGLGASVVDPDPPDAIVGAMGDWCGATVCTPWEGLPLLYPGGVDVVYDTVGAPATVEVGLRILDHGGTLVQLGVSSPGRFEWTPWYFKELRLVGSNAFGFETVEGVRRHAIDHYLDLTRRGRIDLSGMLTHRFALDDWRDAFATLIHQGTTGAIKVAFDLRPEGVGTSTRPAGATTHAP